MKTWQKIFLVIAAILFVALFTLLPYLHNHTPALDEPITCPAYVLEMSLLSTLCLLILGAIVLFEPNRQFSATSYTRLPASHKYSLFTNRAPPQS